MITQRGPSSVFRASWIGAVLLLVLPALAIAQPTPGEMMGNAINAVAGPDLSTKNGPLAKAGLDLALLYEEFRAFGPGLTSSNALMPLRDDRVVVDIAVSNDGAATAALTALGFELTGSTRYLISGHLPVSAIPSAAALTEVVSMRPAYAETRVGLVTSEGDSVMESDDVKRLFGFDGAGNTIGVISNSFNSLGQQATDVASGDLPGPGNPNGYTTAVTIIQDTNPTRAIDEGRAMAQLIHDVAPGAAMIFATGFGGQANFANNIANLTGAGCNIVVDDVFYSASPFFQDGVIAQAVDVAVAAGIPYFSSAGNSARNGYASTWRNGIARGNGSIPSAGGAPNFFGGTTFDFDPGAGTDDMQSITLPAGATFSMALQWDQPFASVSGAPGTQNDIDLYLLNAAGTQVLAGGVDANIGNDAVETMSFTNTTASAQNYNFMISRFSGANPGQLKYVVFRFGGGTFNEWATNSGTVVGHPNAAGAEAVGAAFYQNTPAYGVSPAIAEGFSSGGTTPILFTTGGAPTFDARADKPEIVGPDGTNNTFFGGDAEPDGFSNFFGTSASAPHVAAVAALLIEANGSLTPAQVYSALETTALDMDTPGFDNNTGWGLVQADLALQVVDPCNLTCPANIVVGNDPGACGAVVNFSDPGTSGSCGDVSCVPASGSFFAVGVTNVTCTAASGDMCGFTVTVNDTEQPTITCPGNTTVECKTTGGTPLTDPDIQAWLALASASDNCPGVTIGNNAPAFFAVGTTTTVTFTATDAAGNTENCTADITIVDTTPPDITVTMRETLWPPNHKMVDIAPTVVVTDICDPNPTFVLDEVTSDEPDNDIGDGNTENDIQGVDLGTADVEFQLRSERMGGGDGRKYRVIYIASDMHGNTRSDTTFVCVPHDQRGGAMAATGFNITGDSFAFGATQFALVVPSMADVLDIENIELIPSDIETDLGMPSSTGELHDVGFDAGAIDVNTAYVGNTAGVITPIRRQMMDVDRDGLEDAVFFYGVAGAQQILGDADALDGPIGMHFRSDDGQTFLVPLIFDLGSPVLLPGYVGIPGPTPGPGGGPQMGVGEEALPLDGPALPARTALSGIYPNPFRHGTTVDFSLAAGSDVRLTVYDLRGARVRALANRAFEPGHHQVRWNGLDDGGRLLPRGVYFVHFTADGVQSSRRIVLMQ